MSEQRRSGTESLGKPDASEKHRRSEVRHRHGGGLRLVPGATRQTQACLGLSDSFLVGHTVAAASTGQVVEKSSCRPNAHFTAAARRKNHGRRPTRTLPTPNAQVRLAAGPTRCLATTNGHKWTQIKS